MASIETLIDLGGKEWIKGDHHRVYFNSADELIGLDVARYGTGNISSASLKGEPISNSKAKLLANARVYYDVKAARWVGDKNVVDLIEIA